MSHPLNDTQFFQIAFRDWKRRHGYAQAMTINDFDYQTLSDILREAQQLKDRQKEKQTA
jgi:hypothetical protein